MLVHAATSHNSHNNQNNYLTKDKTTKAHSHRRRCYTITVNPPRISSVLNTATTMNLTSVVRVGPSDDNLSAKLLRNALVSYFEKLSTSTTTTLSESSHMLTISNKYFTANVLLEEMGATPQSEQIKEDGVILVFDALRSNPDLSAGDGASFDSLSYAHQQAEEKDTCGDLLRLCVGVSLSSLSPDELRGKDHEAEYSRRIMWCLDRGYEYVEADLSQEGQASGHKDRDKDGFARIVEAVQGTVWSSAVMCQAKTQQLKETYQEDTAAIQDKEEEEEEENPYEPPDPSKFLSQVNKEETKSDEMLSEEPNAEIEMLLEPEKVGPEEMKQLRKDMETEQVFDKMEGLLKEANRVREASKNGELDDDERRQRAGDAAETLFSLMNAFGLEEDEDSEAGSSDNDTDVADN